MTIVFPLPNNRRLAIPLPCLATVVRLWTWLELAVLLYLVHRGLWTSGSSRGKIVLIGVLWVGLTTLLDLRLKLYDRKDLGLVWENSRQTMWIAELTIPIVTFILFSGFVVGTARPPSIESFLFGKVGYIIVAHFQQFAAESYLFIRLHRLLGKKAPLVTALIFCWAHRPNQTLMFIALVGGWVSSLIFRKYHNLYSLSLAHGIVGAALRSFWNMDMRVGKGYPES